MRVLALPKFLINRHHLITLSYWILLQFYIYITKTAIVYLVLVPIARVALAVGRSLIVWADQIEFTFHLIPRIVEIIFHSG